MNTLFTFIGALIPAFFISRGVLWLMRGWRGGYAKYVAANAISGVAVTALAAFVYADGGSPNWDRGLIYLSAQAVWLLIDLLGHKGRQAEARESA